MPRKYCTSSVMILLSSVFSSMLSYPDKEEETALSVFCATKRICVLRVLILTVIDQSVLPVVLLIAIVTNAASTVHKLPTLNG
jgi:hypothetical protein